MGSKILPPLPRVLFCGVIVIPAVDEASFDCWIHLQALTIINMRYLCVYFKQKCEYYSL